MSVARPLVSTPPSLLPSQQRSPTPCAARLWLPAPRGSRKPLPLLLPPLLALAGWGAALGLVEVLGRWGEEAGHWDEWQQQLRQQQRDHLPTVARGLIYRPHITGTQDSHQQQQQEEQEEGGKGEVQEVWAHQQQQHHHHS